jgi:biopolymer transport protein ExbB
MRLGRFVLLLSVLALATPVVAASATGPAAPSGAASNVNLLTDWVFPVFDYLVLSLLTLASIAGIALAIDAMMRLRESKIAPVQSTERIRRLIEGRNYKELMDFTAADQSFVSRALYAAIRRAHLKYAAMREGMESSVGEQTSDLFRRIEPLNVIGNIGPLLGLLGTVLGMIMAFYQLKQTHGTPDVEKLSLGISTALWHTFFGLFVAIPCLVVYGFYRTKADKIATRAALVAEELLEELRPDPSEAGAEEMRKKNPASREPAAEPAAREPV